MIPLLCIQHEHILVDPWLITAIQAQDSGEIVACFHLIASHKIEFCKVEVGKNEARINLQCTQVAFLCLFLISHTTVADT